jgi:hypothetical protein
MLILGVILLLLWLLVPALHITVLLALAVILIVLGIVFLIRPVGGRRWY